MYPVYIYIFRIKRDESDGGKKKIKNYELISERTKKLSSMNRIGNIPNVLGAV